MAHASLATHDDDDDDNDNNLINTNHTALSAIQPCYRLLSAPLRRWSNSGRDHFSIIKLFAQNKEDRKRVEKALDVTGLPSGKVDSISVSKFQFEDFYNLYKYLTQRSEVERLFDSM